MAGIPVHTSAPINPNLPPTEGPTTAAPTRIDGPASVTASTTALATSTRAAEPGAAPAVPTSSAASAYTPPNPTRTVPLASNASGPPPPQPGQVPTPPTTFQRASIPPPPKAVDIPSMSSLPPIQTQSSTKYPPPLPASPRLQNSTYAYAQPPAGVTSIAQDLSHPPGYIQDHRASFDDRVLEPENRTHTPSPTRAGRGILDGEPVLRKDADGEGSPIWGTAINWAKEAGKKLSEVEGEVWKKLNGDK